MRWLGLCVCVGCSGGPGDTEPMLRGLASRQVWTGTVTWSADFSTDAEAEGAVDCVYTRTYDGAEDQSTPWLCPKCDTIVIAQIQMGEEDLACYRSLFGTEPSPVERIGWNQETFFRTTYTFAPLVEGASRTKSLPPEVTFSGVSDPLAVAAGTVTLTSVGGLTSTRAPGDAWHGLQPAPTSSCGWPKRDPPPYDGPWRIRQGRQVPDGWFFDACDEPVRLHDFAGNYTVIDISAADCLPCVQMAEDEEAFLDGLRRELVPIEGVTLLATSLEAPLDPTDATLLAAWTRSLDSSAAVLGDRGWGWAMSESVWPFGMSYPSWFVVAPNLEVIGMGQGYGGWQPIRDVIDEHRGR